MTLLAMLLKDRQDVLVESRGAQVDSRGGQE